MANFIYVRSYRIDQLDSNQLLLRQLYNDSDNDSYEKFVEGCTKFIYDSSYVGYFNDFGGRPASNHFILVNYDYCSCDTEWTVVNRQFSEKQCKCSGGKLFLAYKIAETCLLSDGPKQKYLDFIHNMGSMNKNYTCWKNIHDEQK